MSAVYEKTAYIVLCRDSAQGARIRAEQTAAHLAYIETVMDELNVAGPLYGEASDDASGDASKAPVASLYCLHTTSSSRAREIIANDPYVKHGAFASIEFFPFLPAAGRYIGGKIW